MLYPTEADLRRLFDRAPVGFYRSTLDGRFLYANPALVSMLGYEHAEDLLRLDMPSEVYADHGERARLIDAYRTRGIVDGAIVRWRTRTGASLLVQLFGTAVEDERGRGFEVTAVDVTALRAAELEANTQRGLAQQSQALLHVLIDQVPAVIGVLDPQLRFTSVAGSGLAAIGRTVDDIVGRSLTEVAAGGSRDLAVRASLAALTGSIEQFEYALADRTIAVSMAPLRRDHAVVGVALVAIDVTEARRLEARLQIAQRAESLGILAGGVAHDFNNLLVAMLGNAELALLDLDLDAPSRACVDAIRTAALRAAELTSQLLAVAGRRLTTTEPVDVRALVAELIVLLRPTFAPELAVDVAIGDDVPPVKADPTQLRQVVLNLIANARDAISARSPRAVGAAGGAVAIRASLVRHHGEPHDDDVLAPPAGTHVVIDVSDDGPGMDEQTRRRIFEPFFTTKTGGHGLGLAAALGIVRGHGGGLRVSSTPGRGTRFQIYWPAVVPARATASRRVLVVDDDAMVRDVVCRMLEDSGYTALAAPDGHAALRRIRVGDRFDAVILDLTMPGMSGRDVLAALQAEAPTIPVIVCSGHERDRADALGAGFLSKPFHFDDLVAALESVLPHPSPHP